MSLEGHRQQKRWPEIEANAPNFVKGGGSGDPLAGIVAQVAFPILAIAPGVRHAGIVCLSGRLRPVVARSCRTRDHRTPAAVAAVLVVEFVHELELRAPGTLVIEEQARAARLNDRFAEVAYERGIHVVRMSLRDACERIAGHAGVRDVAMQLVARYEPLRKRLAPAGIPLLRHERWREAKPLMTAFALAHAHAVDVLTRAVRTSASGPSSKF